MANDNERRMRPSLKDFRAFAADHTVVPVWSEVLGDLETPVAAYLKLVGDGEGFLLESVEHGERWARYSFVGRNPVATLELRDGRITLTGTALMAEIPLDGGMLSALDALIAAYRAPIIAELARAVPRFRRALELLPIPIPTTKTSSVVTRQRLCSWPCPPRDE